MKEQNGIKKRTNNISVFVYSHQRVPLFLSTRKKVHYF